MAAAVDRFREILRRHVGRNELVEIYDDAQDLDKFEVGFIVAVSEDTYFVKKVDAKGRYNGHFMGRLDDVVRLATGTQYLTAIGLLAERTRSSDSHDQELPALDNFSDLLKYAHRNRLMVSAWVDVCFFGFIQEFSKEHLELVEVNKSGLEDGIQYLDIDEVSTIEIGGPDVDARKFLHQVRMGL
jgi:hypothetical protein